MQRLQAHAHCAKGLCGVRSPAPLAANRSRGGRRRNPPGASRSAAQGRRGTPVLCAPRAALPRPCVRRSHTLRSIPTALTSGSKPPWKVSFVIEEANWAKARPWMSAKSTQASSRWSPAFMPLEATRCYLNDEAFRWSFVPRNKGGCRKCHSPLKASSTTHSQRGETFAFTMYLYLHINIASPYALLQTLLGCLAGSLASAPRVRVCACPVRLRGYISKIGSWRW